jgi:hypothetical protein
MKIFCIICILAMEARGAVELSFPLEGYWRPGRYMPVRVSAREAGTSVEIAGEGIVTTKLKLTDGRADVVVPVLVMSAPRGFSGKSFRQVGQQERLVGFTTIDIGAAEKLFAGEKIVAIQLNANDPLPGAAAAWEMLDAVILDRAEAVDAQKRLELAACGVIVDGKGKLSEIVGPRSGAEDLAAFAPVQGWAADWPKAFRRGVMLSAVVAAIVIMGVALMKLRGSAILIALLSAAAAGGLWMWWRDRPVVLTKFGAIVCRSGEVMQRDLWVYQGTASGADSRMAWAEAMHPYFESRMDREAMKPVLDCGEDGRPRAFSFHLSAGQKIGFCMRAMMPTPQMSVKEGVSPELGLLARRMYLGNDGKIVGETDWTVNIQLPKYGEQYPTVVIGK